MSPMRSMLVIGLLTFLSVYCIPQEPGNGSISAKSEKQHRTAGLSQAEIDDWFNAHESELLELVFPQRGANLDPKRYRSWITVSFGTSFGPHKSEWFGLRLKSTYEGIVESELMVANPPIADQAEHILKKENRTVKEVASRIRVVIRKVDSRTCAALKGRFEQAYTLSRPMLRQHPLILHPASYRFVFESNFDDVVDIDTTGPPQLFQDEGDPLIVWLRETNEEITRCIQEGQQR